MVSALACSRLRRSPEGGCGMEDAHPASSIPHPPLRGGTARKPGARGRGGWESNTLWKTWY